jgi:hypothetical protein
VHIDRVAWAVEFHSEFDAEYDALGSDVQNELLAHLRLLEVFGPQLGRPNVDTLNGSQHANMKELRFDAADGVWRFAFAFDLGRRAIVLCGGDKSGGSEKKFYRALISKADARFDRQVAQLKKKRKKQ